VLIPGRALNELQRLLGDVDQLQVRLGDREATFEAGGTRLSTRLIEGEFPNYRNLLPSSYPNLLTVGKAAMLEAIRRVKILAQDSTPVRLTLGGDTVEITAITQDVGNAVEEIDASYDGAEMTVAFNPDYLASGIDAIDSDDVTLATMDPMKPAVLRGVGRDDYLYLLMPVRVP
jgi:DNA polymerase III subunit beta